MIELTDEAIQKIIQLQEEKQFSYIRIGVTGGGCAGFEYIFTDSNDLNNEDIILDYGKWKFLIDPPSVEYVEGITIDYVTNGLNSYFNFINPKEESRCGCGVSINFKV